MWLEQQVSLYSTHSDNTGRPATFREILLTEFKKDMPTLTSLRQLDKTDPDYRAKKTTLKNKLQCYTPAALLASKAKGDLKEIQRSCIMQLDFDYNDIYEYDVEEIKQAIFSLSFIGFCGLSCGGDAFYALALIAEPEKLQQYAEHCFDVLLKYGVRADTSKGKKVENLRYLSYDENMLIREQPEPLRIKHFKPQEAPKKYNAGITIQKQFKGTNSLVNKGLQMVQEAQVGNRFPTVQKVAYTLGGLNDKSILGAIEQTINNSSQYSGEETKYVKCANDCFNAGATSPLRFDYRQFTIPETAKKPATEPLIIHSTLPEGKQVAPIAPAYHFEQPKPGEWDQEIKELENYFASITLPHHVVLNSCTTITNVPNFIASHFASLNANPGKRTFLPFLNRLQELRHHIEKFNKKTTQCHF